MLVSDLKKQKLLQAMSTDTAYSPWIEDSLGKPN